jgi:hypothetical protein
METNKQILILSSYVAGVENMHMEEWNEGIYDVAQCEKTVRKKPKVKKQESER